jgi:signal transduction histidine kinase
MTAAPVNPWPRRWQRLSAAAVQGFHAYAGWLISISWRRFIVLAVLLMIVSGILQNIPPFSWTYTTTVQRVDPDALPASPPAAAEAPEAPEAPEPPPAASKPNGAKAPIIHIETQPGAGKTGGMDISIGERGVRIVERPRARAAASAPAAPSAPSAPSASSPPAAANAPAAASPAASAEAQSAIEIHVPPGATGEAVRAAVETAREAIEEAVQQARDDADAARADAKAARAEARSAAEIARLDAARARDDARRRTREVHQVSLGEFLPSLAMLWIIVSVVIKISYKRQVQAQAQAAQAVETAESESLKRQVVEARMAAMQAQIEPHFLFNTLASIDHLIETDPPRASQMQKNLIALLRASMPTLREAADGGVNVGRFRDLGRELAVIRPYLEILKVRMEERLTTAIDVPEGLLSAEFPPMMLQTLVENAIKHGLEPKPEGGRLGLKAEVVHGKLTVTVTDTGLGFGRAATSGTTAGTGVGLANIRERLQLLYGAKAGLTITENPGGGTRVTLTVPYKPVEGAH